MKKINNLNKPNRIKILILLLISIFSFNIGFATLQLDLIQFDPTIITVGDEVDIVVQFRDNASSFITENKLGNANYKFKVTLTPNDDMTNKYITILDSIGDNLNGATLYTNQIYNKKFRIKVNGNAPTGNYQFKLLGRWIKNGVSESFSQELKFLMNVKKEGILLNIASIKTIPAQIRPGDKFIEIKTLVNNLGFKDSKNIQISLNLPKKISSSYSNNNQFQIGRLNAAASSNISFFINLDNLIKSGVYNLTYNLKYFDLDNNKYFKTNTIPILIKPKANLKILNTTGKGLAGDLGTLRVWVKNIGEKSAENIDVRILKQNSQPFEFDVRSDYIGTLKPNETSLAIFNFKINSNAKLKIHDFKLIIRAKGDSDDGDNNIYTFNRRANFTVVGVAKNNYLYFGLIALILFIMILVTKKLTGKIKK